jgi:hypothetical protein
VVPSTGKSALSVIGMRSTLYPTFVCILVLSLFLMYSASALNGAFRRSLYVPKYG